MMRFDEADPWFTWQQRVERERVVDEPRETLPPLAGATETDPTSVLFGSRPASMTLRFPTESQAGD
jgi:hypothetical protein